MRPLWLAAVFLVLAATPPARAQDRSITRRVSPTAEFEAPYNIHIMPGGDVIEISGTFSWALPQNFYAALARAPHVRTIRFDSPGGHVQPALEIAAIIRARGFDTYVPRFCASACTLAFLSGNHRFLAPGAQLGFHQAHLPGYPPEQFDPLMRAAYEKDGAPAGFIDHVLRTPPDSIWFPARAELQTMGLTAGAAPAEISGLDNSP